MYVKDGPDRKGFLMLGSLHWECSEKDAGSWVMAFSLFKLLFKPSRSFVLHNKTLCVGPKQQCLWWFRATPREKVAMFSFSLQPNTSRDHAPDWGVYGLPIHPPIYLSIHPASGSLDIQVRSNLRPLSEFPLYPFMNSVSPVDFKQFKSVFCSSKTGLPNDIFLKLEIQSSRQKKKKPSIF